MGRCSSSGLRRVVDRAALSVTLTVGLVASCAEPSPTMNTPWFGGYAQASTFPQYEFGRAAAGQSRAVLGFIVADPDHACLPSWEGRFGLEEAAAELHLERQILAFRESGGEIGVSFGGAAGAELATVCADPERLEAAYRSVIDRYDVDMVDFDIEHDDLIDQEAGARRAEVIARLQRERGRGDPLQVWVTLPVAPAGLGEDARQAVARMLEAGVELAGVNIMTMDFGAAKPPSMTMSEASIAAARSTHRQLKDIFAEAGKPMTDQLVWNRMGLTPMIGQNDVRQEIFGLEAAAEVNRFAHEQGLGRLSFWSLARDRPCGSSWPDHRRANYLCSGVEAQPGAFTEVLGEGFHGG